MDSKLAIVGMLCRFPGGAHNPESLWQLLKDKRCTMQEVPVSRFDIDEYWSKNGEVNRMLTRKGHFLKEGTLFDEAFFNLSPREALNTDPQHRILLECTVDALDDAGYRPSESGGEKGWDKSRIGVFVGSATDSYQNNLASNIDAFFCPGTIRGFASGRISHYFGFEGPSIVYDTACSAGLVAVHYACQSLLLKECDAAIASGANMLTSPEMFIGLSKGFFISNTGGCRTFDETADGYCRAEGVGVLVLKRLADAIRDNDKIEAIIAASGTNQSGTAESLTMPHAPTQSKLFASNCERAGISPLAVRAVEAHGTGTQAGDYAEIEAIKLAFCGTRPPIGFTEDTSTTLYVSSLKPNIGHAESSSGIASMIKATMMIKHKTALPHIGVTTRLNPRLGDLGSRGIMIPTHLQPLSPAPGYEHVYISVNNFGAPGGNANVILQDPAGIKEPDPEWKDVRTYHVVGVSAKSHTPFFTIVTRMLEHLDSIGNDIELSSLGYTTTARRVDHATRLAFSVSSIEELKMQLRKASHGVKIKDGYVPRVGFVIAGNGSQFKGMGKCLYDSSPAFRTHVDRCDEILQSHGGLSFLGIMERNVDPFTTDYETFVSSSVCIFAIGYSLGMMWKEWAIKPSAIIGHSLGEFAGLVLAGCLSVEDAIKFIVRRSQLIFAPKSGSVEGGMLVLGTNEVNARRVLEDSGCIELNLSCLNGPSQTCISGSLVELLKLQAFVQALPQPPLVKLLGSKFPWHSPLLKGVAEQLQGESALFDIQPAQTPIILNTDGSVLQPGDTPAPSYLAEQMVMPVRFDKCVGSCAAQEIDIWIELSAKPLLLPLLRRLVPSGVMLLPSLGGIDTDCWSTITKVLARLYEANATVNWAAYHKPYRPKLTALPSYPFARNKHWVPYRDRLHVTRKNKQTDVADVMAWRDIAPTPLGALTIIEPWKRYILRTNGQRLHSGALIWLALSCAPGNSVSDFQTLNPSTAGQYITVLVEVQNKDISRISFLCDEDENSAGNGALIARCQVQSGDFAIDVGIEKIFQRSRAKLAKSPTASVIGKVMASKMLIASKDDTGEDCSLDSLRVSEDGEEAIGQITWDHKGPVETSHKNIFSVPLSPFDLQCWLQPAYLTIFLGSGTASANATYSFDRLDFTGNFYGVTNPGTVSSLCAHVFLDTSSKGGSSTQSYIYSKNESLLVRISGLKKSVPNVEENETVKVLNVPVSLNEWPPKVTPMLEPIRTIYDLNTLPTPPTSATDNVNFALKPGEKKLEEATETIESKLATDSCRLMEDAITTVLAQELGIPAHSITVEDKLEDMGVDSIMSLILRDQLSKLAGKKLKWFLWRRGLSVQDLLNHVLQASS